MSLKTTPQPRYTLQEVASQLHMSERDLFAALRRRRVLDKRNVPHVRYKRAGYLIETQGTYKHPVVGTKPYSRTVATPAGIHWMRTMLASEVAS